MSFLWFALVPPRQRHSSCNGLI